MRHRGVNERSLYCVVSCASDRSKLSESPTKNSVYSAYTLTMWGLWLVTLVSLRQVDSMILACDISVKYGV